MPETRYPQLKRRVAEAIAERKKRDSLVRCMKRGRDNRAEALVDLPGGTAFRQDVKRVKERCIAHLDNLYERFKENAEKRGALVHFAKTGADAIRISIAIARGYGAKTISKSKSLTTEEIEINHPLEEAGFRVIETDLGELIIQLVGEKPYHLVFPSVHKTREDVAEIFAKETGEPVSSDIPSLMRVVRKYLRPIFLNTDIGMTGANIGIAETGGIVIETNEGNGRLVSSIGKCHICVMGIEKIVDTLEDAMLMVLAHPVSASGQLPTTYVTWMHGRNPLGEGGPDRESHIIVLDNGRSEMRADPKMREALHCIRCGACMNVCPTYGVTGGHIFGHIYPGPIGIPWTAQCHGLETAGDFAPLCISCGLCKEICPADIDIPMMIAEVKHRDMKTHPAPRAARLMMAADRYAALGSATAPLSNWMLNFAPFRGVMSAFGLDPKHKLPPFARDTFRKRFARRRPASTATKYKVALFIDV
ncbi:MAG: lactate utilization protein B, partial [Candidatus Hydrogenedentota bacterium]